jgi:hypothetical protein
MKTWIRLLTLLSLLSVPFSGSVSGINRHRVILTWNATTKTTTNQSVGGTVYYYIYRAHPWNAQFVRLNPTTPITTLTYTDPNVIPGERYAYYVTAKVGNAESTMSSIQRITIP